MCKTEARQCNDERCRTWAVEKAQENNLDVVEIGILRRMCEVIKVDRIRNEIIRGTTMVGEISKEMKAIRLK